MRGSLAATLALIACDGAPQEGSCMPGSGGGECMAAKYRAMEQEAEKRRVALVVLAAPGSLDLELQVTCESPIDPRTRDWVRLGPGDRTTLRVSDGPCEISTPGGRFAVHAGDTVVCRRTRDDVGCAPSTE